MFSLLSCYKYEVDWCKNEGKYFSYFFTISFIILYILLPKGGSVNQVGIQYMSVDGSEDNTTVCVCVYVCVGAGSDRQP